MPTAALMASADPLNMARSIFDLAYAIGMRDRPEGQTAL